MDATRLKVFIQQPVIPKYRVPLFNELAKKCEIEVHASCEIPGMPSSAEENSYSFKFKNHNCFSKLGGRLFFQQTMEIPDYFNKGDILVYNSNPRFLSNNKLVRRAREKEIKVIAWNHANSSTSSGISSWLRKRMTSNKADCLLLYMASEINEMENEGWPREKLFCLNNTIDEKSIVNEIKNLTGTEDVIAARNSEIIKEFKEDHGINGKINLLYCGRITEKSSLDILFEALKKVKSKIQLNIIGDGDFNRFNNIENLNIKWHGAIYEEVKLAPWFLSSDAFIYPGAVGLSLNHAMAYGLPVITHNKQNKQMPEFNYLKDGCNGLTYQFQNVDSLVTILNGLEKSELNRLQKNALKTIHEDYSFKKMVQNFVRCIQTAGSIS